MDSNLTAADLMALNKNDDSWSQNPFIYLIYLWIFRMFGNGWGDGNGVNSAATQGALTRAELYDGLTMQDINEKLDTMDSALCNQFANVNANLNNGFNSVNSSLCQGFNTTNTNMFQGFNGLDKSIYTTGASIGAQMADNRYAMQDGFCRTNNAITALSGENYRNTCEITNAIHAEGEITRALINNNTMQELRDKLADKDRDLQTANFRISQYAQNDILIEALRDKTPIPAYLTTSPYTSIPVSYIGTNSNSCGCSYT